ncbi:MAG: calcium-translocating P-type ATPase, PMCA-type [Armatimonadota bacterium]|nr:calcium-translocating P-type ATPase, PMCA-type [bacterium]
MADLDLHSMEVEEALEALQTTRDGLSGAEAARRLEDYGPNEIARHERVSWIDTLVAQVKNPLVYILIIAAAISFATKHATDAAVILAVVVINTVIGFVQEYRAERAMAELAKLAAPKATTRRDNIQHQIQSAELVPGDIILLVAGDRVPADARLTETVGLQTDESALTGESEPVEKSIQSVAPDAPLPDRTCMIHSGTVISRGRGEAVVTATGEQSAFGRIAEEVLSQQRQQTPLQSELAVLGRNLGLVALALSTLVFAAGVMRGQDLFDMFLYAVASAVAAIPEGLPAVVTIALAIGLNAMAKKNAIIRRLPAVEALGSATVIVSDKTGTLTQNKMTVRAIHPPNADREIAGDNIFTDERCKTLLHAAVLASDSQLVETDGKITATGDPTEAALVIAAAKAGLKEPELKTRCPRLAEIPFESEHGYMAALTSCENGAQIYVKGAPEAILTRCSHALIDGKKMPITPEIRAQIELANKNMANQALRMLAVACKPPQITPNHLKPEDIDGGLTHLGLVGMIDPPRPEAIDAVEKCRRAGIRVMMATGDNRDTARAIAGEFGLIEEDSLAIDGKELAHLTNRQLLEKLDKIAVFARVEPDHKLRIVNALKEMGEVVAVTGDGVNDAPALKRADIGVAMGLSGTGVAREAADMILADDNFATIVSAVEEGRIVFERIQKVVSYLIATNAGEILTVAVAVSIGWPLPVSAVQLLWVNLITDSAPSLALAADPPSEDVLTKPPRNTSENVINRQSIQRLALVAPIMAVASLAAFLLGQSAHGLATGRSMAFVTLSAAQLFNAVNVRSSGKSTFQISPFTNMWLVAAIIIALILQIMPVQIPGLQKIFGTVGLSLAQWATAIGLASLILWTEEVRKIIARFTGDASSPNS